LRGVSGVRATAASKQIPFEDDRKKSNGKSNNDASKSGSLHGKLLLARATLAIDGNTAQSADY
jgi:hypothetical protein